MGGFWVIDGKKIPFTGSSYRLIWSDDNRHFAFLQSHDEKNEFTYSVVINGMSSPQYEAIDEDSIKFNADGTLSFIAARNKNVVRVTMAPRAMQ
jgi:hypothetical protein